SCRAWKVGDVVADAVERAGRRRHRAPAAGRRGRQPRSRASVGDARSPAWRVRRGERGGRNGVPRVQGGRPAARGSHGRRRARQALLRVHRESPGGAGLVRARRTASRHGGRVPRARLAPPGAGRLRRVRRRRARAALALGEQFDDLPLQCKALADLGLALVSMGRIDEGLTRLDEALTLISTREVSEPWVVAQAACSLVSACERTGDLSRLDAWKSVIGTASADDEVLLYFCHCRSAYGALLCQAGRWAEAESALRLAFGAAETTRYADHRAKCRSALADLRIRQGRLEEASQLLRGLDDYLDAAHPRAHLHLARREPELAAAVLRRALRELGADRLR